MYSKQIHYPRFLILTKYTNIEIGTYFTHHSYNLPRTDVWAHLQIYELKKRDHNQFILFKLCK